MMLPKKKTINDVPTSILRYLRSKNHNEYIQEKLLKYKIYLETEEDKEQIIFFYLDDRK